MNNVPTTNTDRLGNRNGARILFLLCLSHVVERREEVEINLYEQFNLDPPDPIEPDAICKDYKSDDLYFGDECFATEDGYVLVEDVYEYMEQLHGKVVTIE